MITFTYCYKIKPTKQQVGQFEQYLDICRSVYNYAYAERKAWSDFFKVPGRDFPRFRNKNRFRSFVFPQLGKNCLDTGRVKLPSLGWTRIRQSRP